MAFGDLKISLFGPGMTALHKAGLSGLWMTLDSFKKDSAEKRRLEDAGGSWELSDQDVTLHWEGDSHKFFDALIRESFRLDKEGLVWFPALGEPASHPQASALLNECLLGTFLQHGKNRRSDPAKKPSGSVVDVVDEKEYPLHYHKIMWYQHQKVQIANVEAPQRLVGWVYPGSAVRHEAFDETGIQEPVGRFLPLLYSMIGVLYFVIRSRGERVNAQYAVVVPEVANLREYARVRAMYAAKGERELTVSGSGEAALRVLATLEAEKMRKALRATACRVISFGRVQWDKHQKKRVQVFDVRRDRLGDLRVYQLCMQVFRPRLVEPAEGGPPFWDYPQTPRLVAENLLRRLPWWRGFADFVSDQEVCDHVFGVGRRALYKGEKEGLMKMVQETMPEGAECVFVEACQEAWRRRLGALGERARQENLDFGKLVRRELERTRLSFSKCKNTASLREAVTGFWANAAPLPSLQSDWRGVLSLLNRDWRLAKDLALLALASYASKETEISATAKGAA